MKLLGVSTVASCPKNAPALALSTASAATNTATTEGRMAPSVVPQVEKKLRGVREHKVNERMKILLGHATAGARTLASLTSLTLSRLRSQEQLWSFFPNCDLVKELVAFSKSTEIHHFPFFASRFTLGTSWKRSGPALRGEGAHMPL